MDMAEAMRRRWWMEDEPDPGWTPERLAELKAGCEAGVPMARLGPRLGFTEFTARAKAREKGWLPAGRLRSGGDRVKERRETGGAARAMLGLALALAASTASAQSPLEHVTSVYDGDSIHTAERGKVEVRLAGLDTPELGWRARCLREAVLATQAKAALQGKLGGSVRLERAKDDKGRVQADRDKYGRWLRAAYAADGTDIAKFMLAARSSDGAPLAVPYWGRGTRMDWCKATQAGAK